MALIKCPECGKEVSDKAPQCIHCGYPLDTIIESSNVIQNGFCNIDGTVYDLRKITETSNKDDAILQIMKISGISQWNANNLLNIIKNSGIPETYTSVFFEIFNVILGRSASYIKRHCPRFCVIFYHLKIQNRREHLLIHLL